MFRATWNKFSNGTTLLEHKKVQTSLGDTGKRIHALLKRSDLSQTLSVIPLIWDASRILAIYRHVMHNRILRIRLINMWSSYKYTVPMDSFNYN